VNAKKKRKADMDAPSFGFDELLARLIQTDPSELADAHERVVKEAKAIERYVEEQREKIKSGGRQFHKPFRP